MAWAGCRGLETPSETQVRDLPQDWSEGLPHLGSRSQAAGDRPEEVGQGWLQPPGTDQPAMEERFTSTLLRLQRAGAPPGNFVNKQLLMLQVWGKQL